MSEIVLIDTTVFLNVLNVPGRNQHRNEVLLQFETRIKRGDHFLLPMATIWETGNHISRLNSGARRREFSTKLVDQLKMAIEGSAPYRATHFPDKSEFSSWIIDFPEYAMRNKSEHRNNEGISLSDMSIIKEWERTISQNRMRVVRIWSLDIDLASYCST